MLPEVKKKIDVNRLQADFAAAGAELLSAQCAVDRVRLQYSPQDIAALAERPALKRAIASVEALHRFFSQIDAQIKRKDSGKNGNS